MEHEKDPADGTRVANDDASHRTWFAHERTLLAWWRTALAAIGVALGVGRLLPSVLGISSGPFVVLGLGFGLFATVLVVFGSMRARSTARALRTGEMPILDERPMIVLTVVLVVLLLGTTLALAIADR